MDLQDCFLYLEQRQMWKKQLNHKLKDGFLSHITNMEQGFIKDGLYLNIWWNLRTTKIHVSVCINKDFELFEKLCIPKVKCVNNWYITWLQIFSM